MPSVSTVNAIGPLIATSLSGHLSARTVPMNIKSFLLRTSATSNRFSRSAGTPSNSELWRSVETNDSLTFWLTTRESASQASMTSTRLGLPFTIGKCSAFGLEVLVSRKINLPKIGPSSSPRRISSTRSLIRRRQRTLSLSVELAHSGVP